MIVVYFQQDGDYNKEVPGMHAATKDFGSSDLGIKSKGEIFVLNYFFSIKFLQ